MTTTSYIKCPSCGTMNVNTDYCSECGQIINVVKQRRDVRKARTAQKETARIESQKTEQPSWIKRWRNHSNLFKKITGNTLYAVWVVVMGTAALLAYIAGVISA